MYHSTSSPVFLSNHVALPFSFRSIRRCLIHTSLRQSPPFTAFIPHRSLYTAPPRNSSARCGSLPVGSRPSCFGSGCLCRSLRSHRIASSDYHRRYCRVCFVLSIDYRPSYFGSDNRLRSLHAHRIALLALFPLAGWLLTHPSFRQPPDLLHSLTLPFLCSCSLTQSLCSLMLRSTTLSFAQFTQHSCSMANASFRSSGKICGCQIMIPLPLTFLTHFAIAKSGSPRTKSPPPRLSSAGVTSAHDFALPHATAFAPLASARASSLRKQKQVAALPGFSIAPFQLKAAFPVRPSPYILKTFSIFNYRAQ